MSKIKLRPIGNSLGVILPSELLRRYRLEKGDCFFLTEDSEGLRLSPYNPDLEESMKAAKTGIQKYRNALKQLAQ